MLQIDINFSRLDSYRSLILLFEKIPTLDQQNTNIPVDYHSIMPTHHTLPDDYQFYIDKFFGDDNELW